MTANRDPETILAAWLDEGPIDLPSATRRAIVTALPTTPQASRGPFAAGRLIPMNTYARAAVAVLAIAVLGGGALFLFAPRQSVGGPSPAPSSSHPAVTAVPTAAPTGAGRPVISDFTELFTSSLYGYSVKYPDGWTVKPGTKAIQPGRMIDAETAEADRIGLGGMVFEVISEPVAAGVTEAAWSASIDNRVPQAFGFARNCPTSTTALNVHGEAATELAFADCPVATFMWVTTVHAGRGYQIVWVDDAFASLADAQQAFDGFLLTFTFTK